MNTVRKLRLLDACVAAALMAAIITLAILKSGTKPLWCDELITLGVAQLPDFGAMFKALRVGTDTSPPFMHLLEWVLIRCFGPSELVLRLASTVPLALGTGFMAYRLAGRFGIWLTLLAFAQIGESLAFYPQLFEARFYGLLWLFVLVAMDDAIHLGQKSGRAANIARHAVFFLLPVTHVYGVFYGGLILFAEGVIALSSRPRLSITPLITRCAVYGVGLLLWAPSYVVQSRIGKPYSWIPIPGPVNMLSALSFSIPNYMIVLALVFIAVLCAVGRPATSPVVAGETGAGRNLLIVSLCLLAVIPLSFVISRLLTSIFYGRYFIGALAGVWVLLIWLYDRLLNGVKSRAVTVALALFALANGLITLNYWWRKSADYMEATVAAQMNSLIPAHAVVVCEDAHVYLPQSHYDKQRRYAFVSIKEVSVANRDCRSDWADYTMLRAIRQSIPEYSDVILDKEWNAFESGLKQFYFLDCPNREWSQNVDWSKWRKTKIGKISTLPDDSEIVLCERVE